MKHLKMLGLAAVAACALMAFVGASSASASAVLCENLTLSSGCASSTHINNGSTAVEFSIEPGTSLLMKGPFGEIIATCTESTLKESTSATGSATEAVKGNVSSLSYGPFGDSPSCTATVTSTGTLEVNNIAGTKNGTVKSTGGTIIMHNTPLFGECKYSTSGTLLGTLTGSSNTGGAATLDLSATISSENGCPTESWSGKYVASGATSTYNITPS